MIDKVFIFGLVGSEVLPLLGHNNPAHRIARRYWWTGARPHNALRTRSEVSDWFSARIP